MQQAIFARRPQRAFRDLQTNQARRIKDAIEELQTSPRGPGTLKLEHAPVAQYRYRVGDLRVLFDIDDTDKIIEILDIGKRDEQTYR
jgi:mRNA interferase RelE/StbE